MPGNVCKNSSGWKNFQTAMILYVQQFLMLHHVSGKDFLYDSAVF
jgi:hypothetical protein